MNVCEQSSTCMPVHAALKNCLIDWLPPRFNCNRSIMESMRRTSDLRANIYCTRAADIDQTLKLDNKSMEFLKSFFLVAACLCLYQFSTAESMTRNRMIRSVYYYCFRLLPQRCAWTGKLVPWKLRLLSIRWLGKQRSPDECSSVCSTNGVISATVTPTTSRAGMEVIAT